MMKPAAVTIFFAIPFVATAAHAETVTAEADTLVVVTPNAPVIVQQGGPQSVAPPLAPPGAAEMPPAPGAVGTAAPQNEDWNNVSHINGTPVKVGERGDYLYKFPKTNIAGNPFGLFFGYYDISISRALSQHLAASVAISGWDLDDGYTQGYQIAATLPLYFRRTYSGPYLEGGLLMRGDTGNNYDSYGACYDSYDCMEYDSSSAWVGPQLLFGWHWTFDSGLNIQLASGMAKRIDSDDDDDGYSDGPEVNGYFRVGYAF